MFAWSSLSIMMLVVLYQVHRLHAALEQRASHSHREHEQLFRQVEALHALYADLQLQHSLPSTRGWAASPDFLRELSRHALQAKPQVIVECSSGTSTIVLARCMQLNGAGMVYSLEHDPAYADQTRAELARHGLLQFACVLDAPLSPWYDCRALPSGLSIDMLVVDGPPQGSAAQARYPAGPGLFHQLSAAGTVFLDDAARPDERRIVARWAAEFPHLTVEERPCEKGCAVLKVRANAVSMG